MHCIIFSFNRACQLNTLLESIRNFFKRISVKINVVYNSSDEYYEEGYALLKNKFTEVNFVKEKVSNQSKLFYRKEYVYWRNYYNFFKYPAKNKGSSFQSNVRDLLHSDSSALLFFLTDDSVFVGEPFLTSEVIESIANLPSKSMFSFRHGLNLSDSPKESLLEFDSYAHYKVNKSHSPHWTYKFSVDGHIYDKEIIKKISSKISYSSPNSFEAFLNTYSVKNNYFENIFFNKSNSLVGFELNRVQSFNENNNLNFSTERLNSYFLSGYQLKYLYNDVTDFRPVLAGLEFAKNGDIFQIKL